MTLTHKTGLIALAVAFMATALLLPPTAASANEDQVNQAAFTLVGTAHLEGGITPADPPARGCLGGLAVGGGTGVNDLAVIAAPTAPNAGAQFTYDNSLTGGTAQGDLWIDGLGVPSLDDDMDIKTGFDWQRIGVTALVTLQGNENGVAVAVLIPVNENPFDCTGEKKNKDSIDHDWPRKKNGGSEEHAQIIGVGVVIA